LSGFTIRPFTSTCSSLSIINTTASQITIVFATPCSTVVSAYFYVVALNPNNFLWITWEQINPKHINASSGSRTELFEIPSPVDIPTISDF